MKDEKSQMILEQFQKNHGKMMRDTDAQKKKIERKEEIKRKKKETFKRNRELKAEAKKKASQSENLDQYRLQKGNKVVGPRAPG